MRPSSPIHLGLLRLCDAAPVFLAARQGLFAAAGLQVRLVIIDSWAALLAALRAGELDAAVALPPQVMMSALTTTRPRPPFVVSMSLSSGGNAVTLSNRLAEDFAAGGIARAASGRRLRLAVMQEYSSHELLLRYWLAANGVRPDRDVLLLAGDAAELPARLAAGEIDGFCAGAPWGHMAVNARLGFLAVRSAEIWRGHPEKCLAMHQDFVQRAPEELLALLRVLIAAAGSCAAPQGRAALAAMLAEDECLGLPQAVLAGALEPAQGGPLFTATYPSARRAAWYARQLLRWGQAPARVLEMPGLLYRPDLYLEAGGEMKPEGPEIFCDGPENLSGHPDGRWTPGAAGSAIW